MRKQILMGNWKMNGNLISIANLLKELTMSVTAPSNTEVVVVPPAVYLPYVSSFLRESSIQWGAQNVYPEASGAFTGELSGPMLQDFACHYVLVGHSERRTLFQENEKFVADKFHHVKEHGMIPVLCVGETLAERDAGLTKDVLAKQLQSVASHHPDAFRHTDRFVVRCRSVFLRQHCRAARI